MRHHPNLRISIVLFAAGLSACATYPALDAKNTETRRVLAAVPRPEYPSCAFAVVSDLHYYAYDVEGIESSVDSGSKLVSSSIGLFDTAMERVGDAAPDFLIVSGDLTKDGERASHEAVAKGFAELEAMGVDVYVVPGNHDVNNPYARDVSAGNKAVERVDPGQFAAIYENYGYGEALIRDPESLSYVAEPVPGLWLLAIDSCEYRSNLSLGRSVTAGSLSPATASWIESVLDRALEQGKAVITSLHHGLVEHFSAEAELFPQYLLEGYAEIAEMLAAYKVAFAFTGHFHAHDIALSRSGEGDFLYDVETGSLVTYPCPVRFVEIDANTAAFSTVRIDDVPGAYAAGMSFLEYSKLVAVRGAENTAKGMFRKVNIQSPELEDIAAYVGRAMLAHFAGDETIPEGKLLPDSGHSFMGLLVALLGRDIVRGLYTDTEPLDGELWVDLGTGEWRASENR